MIQLLKTAKAAKAAVTTLTTAEKNAALEAMAAALIENTAPILEANAQDLDRAIRDMKLNEAETALLLELFGLSE